VCVCGVVYIILVGILHEYISGVVSVVAMNSGS